MRYIIFSLLIFCLSCNIENKPPQNVIPKDKMIDILVDMHLADGMFTIVEIRSEMAKKDSINFYSVIFENHGYTRQDFDTTVYYYSHNINEYNKIYIEVLNRLSEMETSVKKEEQEQKAEEEKEQKELPKLD
jgi:hypothetical protein